MLIRNLLTLLLLLSGIDLIFAGDTRSYQVSKTTTQVYRRPKLSDPVLNFLPNFRDFFLTTFTTREGWFSLGAITASTWLLIEYDRELIDSAQQAGRDLSIGNNDGTKTLLSFRYHDKEVPIFRGPTNTGSALYFIGDGWMQISIMSVFLVNGLLRDDYRSLSTASAIAGGLLTITAFTQAIKRTTGRESPAKATTPTGKWQWLPNQNDYNDDNPKYDAFPSGHVTAVTMTWTVVMENYPEYGYIIKPVGGTLISLLAFEMLNNGVHWASDYPMALAAGYLLGKLSAGSYRTTIVVGKEEHSIYLLPSRLKDGEPALGLAFTF